MIFDTCPSLGSSRQSSREKQLNIMGVNTLILLPGDTRINDAAKVIGILAGLEAEKQSIGGSSYACHVKGVEVKPCVAEMASIQLNGACVDGESSHYTTWHWESDRSADGSRLIYPRSTAFWIAIGKKLVDFFGGSVVYSDCDDPDEPDYRAKKPRKANNPSDRKPWHDFQDEMLNLKPITLTDLRNANNCAAYKLEHV